MSKGKGEHYCLTLVKMDQRNACGKKKPKYEKVDLNMCTNVNLLFCLVGYLKSIIAGWKCRCNQNFNFILIISSIAE